MQAAMILAMSKHGENPGAGIDEARLARQRMAREMKRLDEQGEKVLGGGGLPHERAAETDWTEVWGRRIGRGLGYGFALYLIWHLLSTYVLK